MWEKISQLINEPQKSSINESNTTPCKGRLKISNIIHGHSQTSSRNYHIDDESNDSNKSVNEKSRIHLVVKPRARMAKKILTTIMKYKDPHELSTMYKNSHIMTL
jgi:hypothetical protein